MSAETNERRGRAASFGGVADVYERARPGYPVDAVRWLAGDEPCDVVDLGAGTGKLTRTLVDLGHRVTAVEPLPEMLDQLRAAVPEATALQGGAEAIPLPAESADVVTVAQAFHWFDHGPALLEIARVLRPGGHIALVWNVRDESDPLVTELSDAMVGRTGVDARSGRADRRERPVRPCRARHLQPRPGGRPRDAPRARPLPQLLRRPLRGGAGAGAAERRRPVHASMPGTGS